MGTPRKRPVRIKTPPPPPTPPKSNPWDRPRQLPAHGDLERDTTYLSVGRALSHWERFEAYLAMIYTETIGVRPGQDIPALRAYGAIISFSGRAEMVEEATKAFFFMRPNPGLHSRFDELVEMARGYSARRNDLAHGVVDYHPAYYATDHEETSRGHVLLPSEYATKKRVLHSVGLSPVGQIPLYYYGSEHIDGYAIGFRVLRTRAAAYLQLLHLFIASSPS